MFLNTFLCPPLKWKGKLQQVNLQCSSQQLLVEPAVCAPGGLSCVCVTCRHHGEFSEVLMTTLMC